METTPTFPQRVYSAGLERVPNTWTSIERLLAAREGPRGPADTGHHCESLCVCYQEGKDIAAACLGGATNHVHILNAEAPVLDFKRKKF